VSDLVGDFKTVTSIFGNSPTDVIRRLEREIPELCGHHTTITSYLEQASISPVTLLAALNLKEVVGQLNVIIHALGILTALPHVLEKDEIVESISLGAGNTGKKFDLVTDLRVAEFKFIHWRGGAESIRQNNVFKAFLNLLWDTSGKKRQLFLTGTERALSFLSGGRALSSVLSKDQATKSRFESKYGQQFRVVGEFYRKHENGVEIIDLKEIIPFFKIMK